MWPLEGVTAPRGSHGRGPAARGWPLCGPGSNVFRQGSGGMSAQTWGHSSFSFCPVWLPVLEGETLVLVLSQPRTVWLQIGSQYPSEMEYTSHLGSVHKLLQSTYSVPGIDAIQQKYTHDPGKPIFCRVLKNSHSAECRHQMLIINYFFKRRNMRITGLHIYTVNIKKN